MSSRLQELAIAVTPPRLAALRFTRLLAARLARAAIRVVSSGRWGEIGAVGTAVSLVAVASASATSTGCSSCAAARPAQQSRRASSTALEMNCEVFIVVRCCSGCQGRVRGELMLESGFDREGVEARSYLSYVVNERYKRTLFKPLQPTGCGLQGSLLCEGQGGGGWWVGAWGVGGRSVQSQPSGLQSADFGLCWDQ